MATPDAINENREAQSEELDALEAIYDEDCTVCREEHYCKIKVSPVEIQDMSFELSMYLTAYFPESYPSSASPIVELEAAWLQESTREQIILELGNIFNNDVGNVVVFKWIEWLKGLSSMWEEAILWMKDLGLQTLSRKDILQENIHANSSMIPEMPQGEHDFDGERYENLESSSSTISDISLDELEKVYGIVHGSPFTEKRSTFQAHIASVTERQQAKEVIGVLLQNRKIASATHNIMAYRIRNPQKGTVYQDCDDDGETAAGGRLLHLLQIVDATNVVVVVTRWYGGILLGPSRFKHINNAARSLLLECGYIKGESAPASSQAKEKDHIKKGTSKGK